MCDSIFKAHRYSQSNQEYLSLILPYKTINSYSEVMIYGDSDYGYQRRPEKLHYDKIAKYMLDDKSPKILPTSIILGVDKEVISELLICKGAECELDLSSVGNKKIFRIVDGQHRIEGIKASIEKGIALDDYVFNVVILLIENKKRSSELNVFTDINSKSKRIRVDLAELAKHNYEILENKIDNINKHISIKVAYRLKEKKDSIWYKAIKFDIHSDTVLGIVGVNTYCESIEPIVGAYLKNNIVNKSSDAHILIEYTEKAADELVEFIFNAWNIIEKKWSKCFETNYVYDDDQIMYEICYNKNYYLQKTLGVKAINGILGEICQSNGISVQSLETFEDVISSSKLKSEDWLAGEIFSGMSSESGVNKAKQLILSEKT